MQAGSVVCFSTPSGWQGWKDDPHYWDGVKGFNKQLLESEHRVRVSFRESNCKNASECASLTLDTWGRDSRGQPDIQQGLHDLVRQVQQHQDVREDPDPVVTEFGSFDAGNSGPLTIWQIRCSFWNDYFLTMIARRDVLVTIYLEAPDIKDIVSNLDSLKELARSVRIAEASVSLPDIIKIDVVRLSDEAIRQQLLQLTPRGTPMEKVHEFLQSRLHKDSLESGRPEEVHQANGDLYAEIGSYASPPPVAEAVVPEKPPSTEEELRSQPSVPDTLPPTTVVRAFWKFDKQRKLRDIEIQRSVIDFKIRQ